MLPPQVSFFIEILISGVTAGIMYALVGLGFVLIYKASRVFNFAQGVMVFVAALNLVSLMQLGVPLALALLLTIALMVAVAFTVERLVLRPLVNNDEIILFMATIGITFFLEGFIQAVWGSRAHKLDVGIPDAVMILPGDILVNQFDLVASAIAATLVVVLAITFNKTKTGRALRAVADDHQAAQSIGIPLRTIWVIVWSVAGVVALVAAIVWGHRLGVQQSLNLIALKALPVIILGGLTSIPGAIIAGLMVGVGEKMAEIYLGPIIGNGIENWFAFALVLVVLCFRPQGLFGERSIARV